MKIMFTSTKWCNRISRSKKIFKTNWTWIFFQFSIAFMIIKYYLWITKTTFKAMFNNFQISNSTKITKFTMINLFLRIIIPHSTMYTKIFCKLNLTLNTLITNKLYSITFFTFNLISFSSIHFKFFTLIFQLSLLIMTYSTHKLLFTTWRYNTTISIIMITFV